MKKQAFSVAVAGATGAVGLEMIKTLEQRKFPVGSIKLLASERSQGKELKFNGKIVRVEKMARDSFKGVEVALFSAGASRSLEFGPAAAASGAVVVDNSSAFRMDPEIPLVVPEVNPHAIAQYKKRGIIANPNCSTIQMVVALKPIHDAARIKRIVVSTYQAVSGTGLKAIDELLTQTRAILDRRRSRRKVYPHQIAFNCLPHIDSFLENGYTKEEMKMVNETRKIMEDPTHRGHRHHGPGPGLLQPFGVRQYRDGEKNHGAGSERTALQGPRSDGGGQSGHEPSTRWPSMLPDAMRPLSAGSAKTSRSPTASTCGSSRTTFARARL